MVSVDPTGTASRRDEQRVFGGMPVGVFPEFAGQVGELPPSRTEIEFAGEC